MLYYLLRLQMQRGNLPATPQLRGSTDWNPRVRWVRYAPGPVATPSLVNLEAQSRRRTGHMVTKIHRILPLSSLSFHNSSVMFCLFLFISYAKPLPGANPWQLLAHGLLSRAMGLRLSKTAIGCSKGA